MKYHPFISSIFLFSLTAITQAQSAREVRHVILNHTTDSIHYHLQSMSENPCQESGEILPGQFKDLNCKDAKFTSFSSYSLNITDFYKGWFGSTTNRCSSIRGYDVKNNKLFNDKKIIWTIHDACAMDVTEL